MRSTLFMIFSLGLLVSTGCSVWDEIDSAGAKMKAGKKDAAASPASAAATAPTTRDELLEQSKAWWGQATSLAPADSEANIVSCRFRDGTKFMAKDDCLSQGGAPSGRSG